MKCVRRLFDYYFFVENTFQTLNANSNYVDWKVGQFSILAIDKIFCQNKTCVLNDLAYSRLKITQIIIKDVVKNKCGIQYFETIIKVRFSKHSIDHNSYIAND